MFDFHKRERVLTLIQEAIARASNLGRRHNAILAPEFTKALETLMSSATAKHHQALILSAVRRHITQAEKQAIAQIIGDDPIYGEEMSELVRIRLICAELLTVLSYSMEKLKAAPLYG